MPITLGKKYQLKFAHQLLSKSFDTDLILDEKYRIAVSANHLFKILEMVVKNVSQLFILAPEISIMSYHNHLDQVNSVQRECGTVIFFYYLLKSSVALQLI